MTNGVCSTVTLLGEVFADILDDVTWKSEKKRETRKSRGPGPSMGSLRGRGGGGEAQRAGWIAEFLWGNRLGAASSGGDGTRSLWGRVHVNHFPRPVSPLSHFPA